MHVKKHVRTHKIVEGKWTCTYCKEENPGHERNCKHCGAPRGVDDLKLPPEDERKVLTEKELEGFNPNQDWFCENCKTLVSDSLTICPNCSNPRTPESPTYFDIKAEEKKKKEEKRKAEELERGNVKYNKPKASKSLADYFTAEKIFNILKYGGIFAIIVLLIYAVSPKWITLSVESFEWERHITIEKFQTVQESGYYLPENARLLNTIEEPDDDDDDDSWSIREDDEEDNNWWSDSDNSSSNSDDNDSWSSSEDNDWWSSSDDDDWWSSSDDSWDSSDEDSITDLGNGFYDIYDMIRIPVNRFYNKLRHNITYNKTKYVYEIEKWLYDRTITAEGNDHNPYWPKTSDLSKFERISTKTERYYVIGTDPDGKEHKFSLSYSDWESIEIGDEVEFEVSFGSGKIIND